MNLKQLLFNNWNDLVLGLVETCFVEVGTYVPLKRATADVWECHFCWVWVKILQFFKYKNWRVEPKYLILWLLKWSCLKLIRNSFWKLVHTCLWDEPPQVSERFVFREFEWKHHSFFNMQTRNWDLKSL